MRVLLTGAGTPLGRRVLLGLRESHEVLVLVRPGELDALRKAELGVTLIEADPVTPDGYGPRIAGTQVLVHLDQLAQAPDGQLIDHNLKATQSLLHAFSAWGEPERVVHLSSALLDHPSPDEPDVAADRFGSSWLATLCASEARVALYARRSGVETCIVRAGHTFGALGLQGALTSWLEATAASAEGRARLDLQGANIPLPFVHVDELARAIVARVEGQEMPGERRFVAQLSRVNAVGMLSSIEQLHKSMCELTFREPLTVRTHIGARLIRRLRGESVDETTVPRYLRVQPLRVPNADWVAHFGPRQRSQIVDALVGGAC